jgi:citronellol/citronellal dehydrogenase
MPVAARRYGNLQSAVRDCPAVPESKIFSPELLVGRVALVTGGGTGLGRAAAAELVACGAQVVIAGRRDDVLEEAAGEIGERCTWVAGDIREDEDAQHILEAVLERHGRLDVLVNNAGGQYFVPAEAIAPKGW